MSKVGVFVGIVVYLTLWFFLLGFVPFYDGATDYAVYDYSEGASEICIDLVITQICLPDWLSSIITFITIFFANLVANSVYLWLNYFWIPLFFIVPAQLAAIFIIVETIFGGGG